MVGLGWEGACGNRGGGLGALFAPAPTLTFLEMPSVIPPDPTPINPSPPPPKGFGAEWSSALIAGTLSCHCQPQTPGAEMELRERVRAPAGAGWQSDPDRGAGYGQMKEDRAFQVVAPARAEAWWWGGSEQGRGHHRRY